MIRVLLSLALVVIGTTSAFAKPKIAILGLEVTGAVDQGATSVAHDLTEGMRARAKAGNGPYTLAPNSDRELIDEKVIKQCEAEEPGCMSEIGKDIDADVLVYGKLEKDGGGFQATIVMVDVKKKTTIKTTYVTVPPNASSDTVRSIAKKTYLEIAPTASGTSKLVIKANVDSGSVFVDDELRETLSDGHATLTLPEGRYRIAIEADGYKRKEITVKLDEDDSATESFELSKQGKGGGGGGINPWKPIFGVTAIAALGLGGYSIYALLKAKSSIDAISDTEQDFIIDQRGPRPTPPLKPPNVSNTDCTASNRAASESGAAFKDACDYDDANRLFAKIAIPVGAVALVAGYFAFIHGGSEKSSRSAIAITPSVSPEGGGATLRIDW